MIAIIFWCYSHNPRIDYVLMVRNPSKKKEDSISGRSEKKPSEELGFPPWVISKETHSRNCSRHAQESG
jgi:hypothetical protein